MTPYGFIFKWAVLPGVFFAMFTLMAYTVLDTPWPVNWIPRLGMAAITALIFARTIKVPSRRI